MKKEERDKFLTEAIGECWHGASDHILDSTRKNVICKTCYTCKQDCITQNNFSSWTGFGKLWKYSTKQHWWDAFWMKCHWSPDCIVDEIHPDTFANKIYNFLKKIN